MKRPLRSLAANTDVAILSFEGRVEDRGDYLVVESPSNPAYHWGNLLVMRNPPAPGDFERWTKLFASHFAHQPLIRHQTFLWDSPEAAPGETTAFRAAGFKVEQSVVLTATRETLRQPKHEVSGLVIRTIESDDDWRQVISVQIESHGDFYSVEGFSDFKRAQMQRYRAMCEAGRGKWFGAFLDGRLAADCGVYVFGDIGRFQSVGTHPEFRRRGICGNLVHGVAKWAFNEGGAETLVMVADPDYHAAKVYESVGFRPAEKAIGMCKQPPEYANVTAELDLAKQTAKSNQVKP